LHNSVKNDEISKENKDYCSTITKENEKKNSTQLLNLWCVGADVNYMHQ
jgi:hypothetical protein